MIETKERIAFLRKIHLFGGLSEDQLASISSELEEHALPENQVVFERGSKPDGFYLVYKGRVKVTRPRDNGTDFLAWLIPGDYFGEEALFENRNRSATITTAEDSILFLLSRADFDKLLKQNDKLKPKFLVAIKSRKLARALRFKWLGPKEVVYFLARRHRIRLYQTLVAPLLLLFAPILILMWTWASGSTVAYLIGGMGLVADILWAIWRAVDWSNDYYIVTNQRVVWVERVIGIYDSRQEVPLSTILAVNVETDAIGRALDYGNVAVRTFVGSIRFEYVDHPNQAADMIREYWDRTKGAGTQAQKVAMTNALLVKLGRPAKPIPQADELPPVAMVDKNVQKKSVLRIVLANMFKLRVEDGGTVTYRKHWYVLLQQLGRPLMFLFGVFILIGFRLRYLYLTPNNTVFKPLAAGGFKLDTSIVLLLFLMLPILGWMLWEFVDWDNDIFKVTPEEIVDMDRTPFGTEERRSAQIENILSTEYERIGVMGYLLNYGTVHITVGGTKLAFEDVLDPAGVQADINRRRMARIARKGEDAANVERERMATWLAAYHENLSEFDAPVSAPVEDDSMKNPGVLDGSLDPPPLSDHGQDHYEEG
ncbi:MAG: cyclic nucleotide-binding domain-containing protein [Chloroflexi bacterium]|nr:cyclic nucleotide-binding domain-containing protein [Chloroflexota bacterium]